MNARGNRTWAIFAAMLALVVVALFWVTREVLDLERREARASDDAHVQEAIRLALWRMDSAFAPVLAQETLRTAADESVLAAASAGLPAAPESAPASFKLAFAIDASGRPMPAEIAPFVGGLMPELRAAKAQIEQPQFGQVQVADQVEEDKRLDDAKKTEFSKESDGKQKAGWIETATASRPASYPAGAFVVIPPMPGAKPADGAFRDLEAPRAPLPPAPDPKNPPAPQRAAPGVERSEAEPQASAPPRQQEGQAKDEYQSRAKMAREFQSNVSQTLALGNEKLDTRSNLTAAETGPLEAKWLTNAAGQPELFFVRRLRNKFTLQETVQGLWCDWPKLEQWLVSGTRDLFADAKLEPAPNPTEADQASLLATIPARLVPGPVARVRERPSSPTRLVLAAAWVAAIGAIAAVGGVLKAAMSLGERRGRFVSAVTHELRTPLTTFRMYSQMLADGMVPVDARPEYLVTLRDESERLTRVVESVLLYSRLEEGRGGAHRERIAARALVDRLLPPISKRAVDGGMALATVIEVDPGAACELDVQAVEQIVLNLVDNACKYAAPTCERLELGFRTTSGRLLVRCRDFGPGIPDDEREAVFLPFRRGAKDAAGTTPGVGLGLALARGLARALGGGLALEPCDGPGACFIVTIPLSSV